MATAPPFRRYRGDLKLKARELRNNMPEPERKLWFQFLRGLPVKFLRQKPLADYVVDFYCSQLSLAIEIDGDTHYTHAARDRDEARTKTLARLGVRVLRFTNREVMREFDGVCERILEELNRR